MDKNQYGYVIICSIILSFSLISILACIVAEFKRTKVKDLKLDGKLCHLSESPAFGLGLIALICLLVAQIVGTMVICRQICPKEKKPSEKMRKQMIAITLFALSWISFGFAIILLGVATSMNRRQVYGKGWLNGECYIVKSGVFMISGALGLTSVIFMLGSIFVTKKRYGRGQDVKLNVEKGKATPLDNNYTLKMTREQINKT